MAKRESVRMIAVMETTTAEVAAVPTAEALDPLCMPRRQPAAAMMTPKMMDCSMVKKWRSGAIRSTRTVMTTR